DQIYYTTDGTKPNEYSSLYRDSISIGKTTHFTFRAKKDGKYLDTIIQSFYLIDFPKKFPVLSISIPKDDLWSSERGLFSKGENPEIDSLGKLTNCNYHQDWEKKVTMMYIVDSLVLHQECGMKIFGESTRSNQDKSFKLIARKKYGNNLFSFPFFANKSISKHKQLVVRASGNDFKGTRFKDVLSAHIVRNLAIDYMDYQPIHLYVNGTYWGVYNLREKINEHYFKHNKVIHKDSVNVIMGKWVRQQGSAKDYLKMYNWFYRIKNMDSANYCLANDFLDIRNYINYRIFQLFINNVDSRGNIRYWNSSVLDGRFRMVLYDTDHGYGAYKRKFLKHSLSANGEYWYNPPWSTRFLRKLMLSKEFENEFLVQYSHLLNTALNRDTILEAIANLKSMYKYELPRPGEEISSHLRGVPLKMEKWEAKVDHLNQFTKLRFNYVKDELLNLFSLEGWVKLKLGGNVGRVSINDNLPLCFPFEGEYLKGTELSIHALDDGNFSFVRWMDGDSSRARKINFNEDIILEAEYKFNEIKRPAIPVIAENKQDKQKTSFLFGFNVPLLCIGIILIILGTALIVMGLLRIKKARLSGLK
ncbi:MAG: CotH kinase family protein, partial [Bacteroidota bacterium]|nr:CotH kinase family protein [Bacteroidota bacterium]